MSSEGIQAPARDLRIVLGCALLIFVVAVLYCNLAVYLSLAVNPRLEPQYWIMAILVFAALTWLYSKSKREIFTLPLFYWCLAFLTMTVVWYLAIPSSTLAGLKSHIRATATLVGLMAIFLYNRNLFTFLRRLLFCAVVIVIAVNILSFFSPHLLVFSSNVVLPPPGRTGGLYINPNEDGAALVYGMIFSVGLVGRRWRSVYALAVLIGIGLTFSRGALAGWALMVAIMCVLRILDWKAMLLHIGVLVAGLLLLWPVMHVFLSSDSHAEYADDVIRMKWLLFPNLNGDRSAGIRLQVLRAGWAMFLRHPWIGNGLGSTFVWNFPDSTHNMYLRFMDDFGILGLLLFLTLGISVVWRARGEVKSIAVMYAAFLLYWSWMDHNILSAHHSLFCLALMATLAHVSRNAAVADTAPATQAGVAG